MTQRGAYQVYPKPSSFITNIMKAINGEYSAVTCYEHLAQLAPTEQERNQILEIRQDEILHYHVFAHIYMRLTGHQPTPHLIETCPTHYLSGLEYALKDEQETVDFYLELADQAPDPQLKQQFTRIASDEQNHAVWFLYFYTKNRA